MWYLKILLLFLEKSSLAAPLWPAAGPALHKEGTVNPEIPAPFPQFSLRSLFGTAISHSEQLPALPASVL